MNHFDRFFAPQEQKTITKPYYSSRLPISQKSSVAAFSYLLNNGRLSTDGFYIYCSGGCTFKQLIENINNYNPENIVIFYVGLRNYGDRTPGVNPASFNTYDINDVELRKKVVALILTSK